MTTFDQARAEEFGGRMLGMLNNAALSLMVSIGHRTGLLDTLADAGAVTCEELAKRAGLQERYVREWLGAMVTGQVVELDEQGRYRLPAEHAALLTRTAALGNMAAFAQYIPLLGQVEDDVVACFSKGGGVPYEKFPRFHAVMAEDSGQTVLPALDQHILPLIPDTIAKLESGADALDIACGRGLALLHMAARFPASRFVGLDLSEEAIGFARAEAKRRKVNNVRFDIQDLSTFDQEAEAGRYDLVTVFDGIHDQGRPRNVLRGIARTLRDDGVMLMQDIRGSGDHNGDREHPAGTFLYTVSCMHCMTVSLAQGGEGLGTMWGEPKTREYLQAAGFRSVETHTFAHDFQNNFYVARK